MSINKKYSIKNILDYLNNKLGNKERYELEKDISSDPFLSDAMDGFSEISVDELNTDLSQLSKRMKNFNRPTKTIDFSSFTKVAASVILILGIGTIAYFYIVPKLRPQQLAKLEATEQPTPAINTIEINAEADNNDNTDEVKSKEALLNAQAKASTTPSNAEYKVPAKALVNKTETIEEEKEPESRTRSEKAGVHKEEITIKETQESKQAILANNVVLNEEQADEPSTISQVPKMQKKSANVGMVTDNERNFDLALRDTSQKNVIYINYLSKRDTQAAPINGYDNFDRYILKYKSKRKDTSCRVKVEFVVDPKGRLTAFFVENTDDVYANEVIRLLKEGPKWKAAIKDSLPTNDTISISVAF